MKKCIAFVKAARLRTLPLSLSGICVGSALAFSEDFFKWKIFLLALLTTILFQILSNFANDYGDGTKGTDNNDRLGPKRALQSGEITPSQMKKAVIITAVLSLISAMCLIFSTLGFEKVFYILLFMVLGISAIIAAIKYTVGKSAYGYSGFGDLFVFIFFGIISVVGSYFLYAQQLDWAVFLPAISVGFLSVAVLNLNNMRDIENDKKMGKNTLVVKIGMDFAKIYHYYLIVLAMVLWLFFSVLKWHKNTELLYIVGFIPLIKHLFFVKKNTDFKAFDSQLKIVSLSTFLIAILFFLGQIF